MIRRSPIVALGILRLVLAGFLLILGGGLIGLGSQQDWLTANLAKNESATLNVAGSRFGNVLLLFAGLVIVLGFVRISRGYSEDSPLHQIASLASLAALVTALVRTWLFLVDHHLSVISTSSYGHLDLKLGVLMLLGGAATTFVSRFA